MSNDKDSKSNGFKQERDLEDLMKIASENSDGEVNIGNELERKDSKRKAFLLGLASFGVLSLLVVSSVFLLRGNSEFEDKTATPDWVNEATNSRSEDIVSGEYEFDRPVSVPEWATTPYDYNELENSSFINAIEKEASNYTQFYNSVSWLPSKETYDGEGNLQPYTSDSEYSILPNGENNPMYVRALQEDYREAYVTSIYRLINPVFGNWDLAERSSSPTKDNIVFDHLMDMFSSEWWEENIVNAESYSNLPILADWDDDNFGGLEIADMVSGRYGKFYGEINETEEVQVTSEFISGDEVGQEKFIVMTPVKYTAFGANEKLLEKYGMVELHLSPVMSVSSESNRVVVTYASLSVD